MKKIISILLVFIGIMSLISCSLSYRVEHSYFKEGKINITTMLKEEKIVEIQAIDGRYAEGVISITEEEKINEITNMFLDEVLVETNESEAERLSQHYIGFVPDLWLHITFYTQSGEHLGFTVYYDTALEISVSEKVYVCKSSFVKDYILLRQLFKN